MQAIMTNDVVEKQVPAARAGTCPAPTYPLCKGDPPWLCGRPALPLDQLSDAALMTAITTGAMWALDQLYHRYSRSLYSLACSMIADHTMAEDFVQETFIAVWQHADSYSPRQGSVNNWLCSIERHRIIDYLRSSQRRSSLKHATWGDVERDERTAIPDVWEEAWRLEQREQVRAALKKLSPEQLLMIQLAFFQGWTYSEIAEQCALPLGTVKARIRRAAQART